MLQPLLIPLEVGILRIVQDVILSIQVPEGVFWRRVNPFEREDEIILAKAAAVGGGELGRRL